MSMALDILSGPQLLEKVEFKAEITSSFVTGKKENGLWRELAGMGVSSMTLRSDAVNGG